MQKDEVLLHWIDFKAGFSDRARARELRFDFFQKCISHSAVFVKPLCYICEILLPLNFVSVSLFSISMIQA